MIMTVDRGPPISNLHGPSSLEDTADGVLALLSDQQGHDDIALLLLRPAG